MRISQPYKAENDVNLTAFVCSFRCFPSIASRKDHPLASSGAAGRIVPIPYSSPFWKSRKKVMMSSGAVLVLIHLWTT